MLAAATFFVALLDTAAVRAARCVRSASLTGAITGTRANTTRVWSSNTNTFRASIWIRTGILISARGSIGCIANHALARCRIARSFLALRGSGTLTVTGAADFRTIQRPLVTHAFTLLGSESSHACIVCVIHKIVDGLSFERTIKKAQSIGSVCAFSMAVS